MRALFSICVLLLVSACSSSVGASRLIDMQIIDRQQGQAYTTYHQNGQRYVAGNPGELYTVRLSNRSNERVLAVLSVDGVNAITGETAGAQQSGYVLDPYASIDIAGWRKSEREVAQFYFTSLNNSYAARTGRPDNVGVIGVAAYREKLRQPIAVAPEAPYLEKSARRSDNKVEAESAASMGALADSAAPAKLKKDRLGTGHGAREYAPVSNVEFERRSTKPEQIISLFYDSRVNLVARGIIPHQTRPCFIPQPFPQGFVPDPS